MKTKDLCLIALNTILLVIGTIIKIPISMVPITLQTLFVILNCYLLREKAKYVVMLYLLLGLIGFPVFTNGGGITYIFMPSFGYVIGFLICTIILGNLNYRTQISYLLNGILGIIIIYIIGIFYFIIIEYFYYQQTFTISYLFLSLFIVYIPGDILSVFLAILIYNRLRKFNII